MTAHYVQAKVTESIEAAIGGYFPSDEPRHGELYRANIVSGRHYEYLAGDACGCGCHGEAVLIAYLDDGVPVSLWLCGSLFDPV